jgi:hypothetical protein
MQILVKRNTATGTTQLSSRLLLGSSGRALAFCLLISALISGMLLSAGCDTKVPLKEDAVADYEAKLRASPQDLQVMNISSVVTWNDDNPVLTMMVLAYNPNNFPRAFRSMKLEIFDEQGRQQGFQTWTTQRSPFIVDAQSSVPIAVSFPGKSEWYTAKAYFSSQSTPSENEVHLGLQAVNAEPVRDSDGVGASITVRNMGTSSAVDVIVLAAGYDDDGEIVAWAEGRQQWRTIPAAGTATFDTHVFQGDNNRITSVQAFMSAYRR